MCQRRFRWLLLIVPILTGCGGSGPVPVRGRVLLDGVPVAGATVTLVPVDGGHPADGWTDSDGVFRLKTFKHGDGALPGAYKILVTKTEAIPPPPLAESGDAESVINHYKALKATREKKKAALPPIYGDVVRTPLRCTVPLDDDLDLSLQGNAK